MRHLFRSLGVCCALVFVLATQAYAQGKIKVAIWEFDNNAAHTYWYWDKMGPAARNIIDTAFSENKLLSGKFSVVERDKLNLVLKEQGLAQTGAIDPASAAKVDNTKAGLGRLGVGGNLRQSNATVNLRVIDSTTAERVISISGDGQVKKGGGFVKDASFSRDAEWGIASETINE